MIENIERDTLEDPPLLFKEYVGAPAEIKRIMDSQFKLVKTWARLKAKGGWYSWRDQLLGGVMPTLIKNAEGLRKVLYPVQLYPLRFIPGHCIPCNRDSTPFLC